MKNRCIRIAALGVLTLAATFGALQLGVGTADAGPKDNNSCKTSCILQGGGSAFCQAFCGV